MRWVVVIIFQLPGPNTVHNLLFRVVWVNYKNLSSHRLNLWYVHRSWHYGTEHRKSSLAPLSILRRSICGPSGVSSRKWRCRVNPYFREIPKLTRFSKSLGLSLTAVYADSKFKDLTGCLEHPLRRCGRVSLRSQITNLRSRSGREKMWEKQCHSWTRVV